jgi:hypothetical protein
MALDCFCHKCNGKPETDDNFFEICENEISDLKIKSLQLDMKSGNSTIIYCVVGFLLFIIFSCALIST